MLSYGTRTGNITKNPQKKNGSFPLSGTVWYSTVSYTIISVSVPLAEVGNGTKIANRTVPIFWYPSVGVPSTGKGTKRVELNSLQNVDWLTRIVTCVWYKGIKLLLTFTHSFRSAVFGLRYYFRVRKHKTYNRVYYIFTQTIAVSQYAFLSVLVDLWNVIAPKPASFSKYYCYCVMKCNFKSFSEENVVV